MRRALGQRRAPRATLRRVPSSGGASSCTTRTASRCAASRPASSSRRAPHLSSRRSCGTNIAVRPHVPGPRCLADVYASIPALAHCWLAPTLPPLAFLLPPPSPRSPPPAPLYCPHAGARARLHSRRALPPPRPHERRLPTPLPSHLRSPLPSPLSFACRRLAAQSSSPTARLRRSPRPCATPRSRATSARRRS